MHSTPTDYQSLLQTPTRRQWEKIGIQKRAGCVVPLFSVFSNNSLGIGELTDLRLIVDWCASIGLSIIQLLPLNDVGFNFTPYDAQSSFALDPMFISLSELTEVDPAPFKADIEKLKSLFPNRKPRVDYGIKRAKCEVLWKIFKSSDWNLSNAFHAFQAANQVWLEPYACFKLIKELQRELPWFEWPEEYKSHQPEPLKTLVQNHQEKNMFHIWLQWQLKEQLAQVKAHAQKQGILLMGDLPFLVSRDSADVWTQQNYFKLNLSAGAPPDMFFAKGQRWGMPPYDWETIAAHDYDYLKAKLRYAEIFYDLYRIDHFVGIFRLWTIALSEPSELGGLKGNFDPPEESRWEEHGKKLLQVMVENTLMLPCAEDLGTVPNCSNKVIKEYGIVGTDVQRWVRDWDHSYNFKSPEQFRPNAIVALSTHDLSNLKAWWEYEIGTLDELLFRRKCTERGFSADELIPQLFNVSASYHGRLRWRPDINQQEQLTAIFGRPAHDLHEFINFFRETRFEREKFIAWLGEDEKYPERLFTLAFAKKIIEKVNQCVSIFSLQTLIDWLLVGDTFRGVDSWSLRFNYPGTIAEHNWSLVMPFSLEELLTHPSNQTIREINQKTRRS